MVAVDTFVESCFQVVLYASMLIVSIQSTSELGAGHGIRERPLVLLVGVPISGPGPEEIRGEREFCGLLSPCVFHSPL